MVCVKGYARVRTKSSLNRFRLTPNDGGNQLSSDVLIELPPGQFCDCDTTVLAVSGTLVRMEPDSPSGIPGRFKLANAKVRWPLTRFGLARRTLNRC